ncbi:MAG: sialidase family protein [Porphyromonas sp.]|nr:sialidase family protein [Porphyromonas sp.]
MTKKVCLIALLVHLLCGGMVYAEGLKVFPSRHGVEAGEHRKTLVAVQLDQPLGKGDQLHIDFAIPIESQRLIQRLQVLVSDSLAVRDLDDYKGRINYRALPLNSWSEVTLTDRDLRGDRVVYITADLATPKDYSPHHTLRYRIRQATLNGVPVKVEQDGDETYRRFYRTYRPLYVPGDGGSRNYRIPVLHKTEEGTLLAIADRRKFNQVDIPEDIDIIQRRSFDNGKTWIEPEILIAGQGYGKGYGDAAVVQTKSGKLVMLFIGGPGLWHSRPDAPQPTYMMTSDDDGATWSQPRDITRYIFGSESDDPDRQQWWSSFCASGQGAVTESGRIMFVAAIRKGEAYSLDNHLIYSDDEGESWHVSETACIGGDEAKVIVMPDRSILMSVRNPRQGDRIFKVSYDNGETWQSTGDFAGLHDPACNGAPLLMEQNSLPILLHSLPYGPGKRWDGAVYGYDPYTRQWSDPVIINPGMSAYSDMVDLGNGQIGYFVEEDDEMSLVFITFTLEDLQALQ